MKTPLLDAIIKSASIQAPMGFNSGFTYFPMDTPAKPQKIEEPEEPQTIQDTKKARGVSDSKGPKGPQATAMTASKDNVANYQPKGIS